MEFEWDDAKRETNLARHGIDFLDAGTVFDGHTASLEDTRRDYHEQRFVTFGLLKGVVIAIVHTERREAIRIISMRKASKHEERSYFFEIRN